MLGCFFSGIQSFVEALLCVLWRGVSYFAAQVLCVVPMHLIQGFPFDLTYGFPRPYEIDDFGFEQANCTSCQRVVI